MIQPVAAQVARTTAHLYTPAPQERGWHCGSRPSGCPRRAAQPQEQDHEQERYEPEVSAEDWYEHVVAEQTAPSHAAPTRDASEHVRAHQEQVRQAQIQHDKARFGEQLAALHEMGFSDDEDLIALLHKYNGVVPRVVSDLFARKA